MSKTKNKISISDILLDDSIYPREKIDHKRISIFADNLRDGFKFEPIEIQSHPEIKGKYRILDGAHRWSAYKEVGQTDLEVIIRTLREDCEENGYYSKDNI